VYLTSTAAVFGLGWLIAVQTPGSSAGTDTSGPKLPVSLNRIREMLGQPVGLRVMLPERKVDFRVDVHERQPAMELLDTLDFRSGPVPPGGLYAFEQRQRAGQAWSQQPLIQVDLLAIAQSLGTAAGKARRTAAENAARQEVVNALREFCATHNCPVP
jgi:hypothetical protein